MSSENIEPIIEEPEEDDSPVIDATDKKPNEEIVVPREARKVIDNDQENEESERIFFRRIIIAPVSAFMNSINQEAEKLVNKEKIRVEPFIPPVMMNNINEKIDKQFKENKENIKQFKKTHIKAHSNNNDNNKGAKNEGKRKKKKETVKNISGGNQTKNSENMKFNEDLSRQVLQRCYMFISALIALIVMLSYVSYRLVHEITIYKQVKTADFI